MKDRLFRDALAASGPGPDPDPGPDPGSPAARAGLDALFRPTVPDCRGTDGVRGEEEGGGGEVLAEATMCEMYSPRMRALSLECNEEAKKTARAGPAEEEEGRLRKGGGQGQGQGPDPLAPLLEYAARRRAVWCQTVLPIRRILSQSRLALGPAAVPQHRQQPLQHGGRAGGLQEISTPSAHSYSQPGLGTFANHDYLQGARYGAQATGITASYRGGSQAMLVGQLEQQWRAVE